MKKLIRMTLQAGAYRTMLVVAVGMVALIALLTFAYTASAPSVNTAARRSPATKARSDAKARTETKAPAAETSAVADTGLRKAESAAPSTVTITGCLERSDNEFRLNETSGTDAPKARNWKSGFLTKRSASVTIVPDSKELQLSKHLGQRVTVTGPLNDRQMRVRTLRRLSPCGNASRETA